jgi:hypothetical protein
VVRECHAGEAGEHVLGGDAACDERVQGRGQAAIEEVGSEAIQRDEDGGGSEECGTVGEQRLGMGECGAEVAGGFVGTKYEDQEEDEDESEN